jgi:diguanylate cyclase (GGDEF)-like protein
VFVASAIAEIVIHVVLAITGGVASNYFPFVFMPVLVMVMTGRPQQTLILAGLALAGLVILAIIDISASTPLAAERDLFAIRALELATFSAAAAAIARATGAVTAALSARGTTLAASARTDPLTGLGNRRVLEDELRRMLASAERTRAPLAIVALDLDGFKSVNDRFGHETGDRVLSDFARVLVACIRGNDVAIRAGGDEFFMLLPDTSDTSARRVVERVRERAGEVRPGMPIQFSAGIAPATSGIDAAALLKRADEALYAEKLTRRAAAT